MAKEIIRTLLSALWDFCFMDISAELLNRAESWKRGSTVGFRIKCVKQYENSASNFIPTSACLLDEISKNSAIRLLRSSSVFRDLCYRCRGASTFRHERSRLLRLYFYFLEEHVKLTILLAC